MKYLSHAAIVAASLTLAPAAFAQSVPEQSASPPASAPVPAASAVASPGAAAPVAFGKRMTCQIASRAVTGQEKIDRIQLCMAQAHLDCLKQAIDQKIVGPQRRDFVKSCAEQF